MITLHDGAGNKKTGVPDGLLAALLQLIQLSCLPNEMKEKSMQSRPVGIYQELVLKSFKHLILTNRVEGITEVKLLECI